MRFLIILLFLISCRPENQVADFNITINPANGVNKRIAINEDEASIIEYSVDENADSQDLSVFITEVPDSGSLSGCLNITPLKIQCTFIPEANFNGETYIRFRTKDGDIKSQIDSFLYISILPVNDAPFVGNDQTINVSKNNPFDFYLSPANDPDFDKDLEYIIESYPVNGTLSGCNDDFGRFCKYTPNQNYLGDDSFTYYVKDPSGLRSISHGTVSIKVTERSFQEVEQFTVGSSDLVKKVDIVWVIDNSGSMREEQENLKTNFDSLVNKFIENSKAKFPFNMAVTTTDNYLKTQPEFRGDINGQYNLSSVLAESNYSDFKTNFNNAVGVGIDGSGSEKTLLSLQKTIDANLNFFGEEDTLEIYILLSDESEQSNSKTIGSWLNYFKNRKSNSSKVKFFPIVALGNDTQNHYQELARETKGKVFEITQSFDNILDEIGFKIDEIVNSFLLKSNREILANTIEVKVNNKILLPQNWNYKNGALKVLTPLKEGDNVSVSYSYHVIL